MKGRTYVALMVVALVLSACTTNKAVKICLGEGGHVRITPNVLHYTDLEAELHGPGFYASLPAVLGESEQGLGWVDPSVAAEMARCRALNAATP